MNGHSEIVVVDDWLLGSGGHQLSRNGGDWWLGNSGDWSLGKKCQLVCRKHEVIFFRSVTAISTTSDAYRQRLLLEEQRR